MITHIGHMNSSIDTYKHVHMLVQDVETVSSAIKNSPLKLQPRVEGNEVQVPIPR